MAFRNYSSADKAASPARPNNGNGSRPVLLHVRKVPFALGDLALRRIFEGYGVVRDVNVITPKFLRAGNEHQRTRVGKVSMGSLEDANKAIFGLHKQPPAYLDVQIAASELDNSSFYEIIESIVTPLEPPVTPPRQEPSQPFMIPAGIDITTVHSDYNRRARHSPVVPRNQSNVLCTQQSSANEFKPDTRVRPALMESPTNVNNSRNARQISPQAHYQAIRGRRPEADHRAMPPVSVCSDRPDGQLPLPNCGSQICSQLLCGKLVSTNNFACGKCHAVAYCSSECQTRHWFQHEMKCEANINLTGRNMNQGNANQAYQRGGQSNSSGNSSRQRPGGGDGGDGIGHWNPPGQETTSERRGGGHNNANWGRGLHHQRDQRLERGESSGNFEVGQWPTGRRSSEFYDGSRRGGAIGGDGVQQQFQGRNDERRNVWSSTKYQHSKNESGDYYGHSKNFKTPQEAKSVTVKRILQQLTDRPQEVIVSHVIDPSDFYLQISANENILASIMRQLQKCAEASSPLVSVAVGQSVAAKYSGDQIWYRATVTELTENGCVVRYIDYGNTEMVILDNLRSLSEELLSGLPLALRCCLEGTDGCDGWNLDRKVNSEFQKLVNGRTVFARNVKCVGDRNVVTLSDNKQDGKDFSQLLRIIGSRSVLASCMALWQAGVDVVTVVSSIHARNKLWLTDQVTCKPGIESLMARLQPVCEKTEMGDLRMGCPPAIVAAKSSDGRWYRTIMTEQLVRGWQVDLLDFGRSEHVLCVQALARPFYSFAAQAVLLEMDDGLSAEQRTSPPPPPLSPGDHIHLKPLVSHSSQIRVQSQVELTTDNQQLSPAFFGRAVSFWLNRQRHLDTAVTVPDNHDVTGAFGAIPEPLSKILRASTRSDFPVVLQRLESGRRLYVQLFCEETHPIFEELQSMILDLDLAEVAAAELEAQASDLEDFSDGAGNTYVSQFIPCFSLGDQVCVRSVADGLWHRACVIGLAYHGDIWWITVFLLDLGNVETVASGTLMLVPTPPRYRRLQPVCLTVRPMLDADNASVADDQLRDVLFTDSNSYWSLKIVDAQLEPLKVTLKDGQGRTLDSLLAAARPLLPEACESIQLETDSVLPCPALSSELMDAHTHQILSSPGSQQYLVSLPPALQLRGQMQVLPVFLESTERLYVHVIEDDTLAFLDELDDLEVEIGSCSADFSHGPSPVLPAVGHIVCALYEEDGNWYRALVEDVTDTVGVHFVDYGNRARCPPANLRPIPSRYHHIRVLASAVRPLIASGMPVGADHEALNRVFINQPEEGLWSLTVIGDDPVSAIFTDPTGRTLDELLDADAASSRSTEKAEIATTIPEDLESVALSLQPYDKEGGGGEDELELPMYSNSEQTDGPPRDVERLLPSDATYHYDITHSDNVIANTDCIANQPDDVIPLLEEPSSVPDLEMATCRLSISDDVVEIDGVDENVSATDLADDDCNCNLVSSCDDAEAVAMCGEEARVCEEMVQMLVPKPITSINWCDVAESCNSEIEIGSTNFQTTTLAESVENVDSSAALDDGQGSETGQAALYTEIVVKLIAEVEGTVVSCDAAPSQSDDIVPSAQVKSDQAEINATPRNMSAHLVECADATYSSDQDIVSLQSAVPDEDDRFVTVSPLQFLSDDASASFPPSDTPIVDASVLATEVPEFSVPDDSLQDAIGSHQLGGTIVEVTEDPLFSAGNVTVHRLGDEVKVLVTHVVSAQEVYLQCVDALPTLSMLVDVLDQACESGETTVVQHRPPLDHLLCGRYSVDGHWYRCRVTDVSNSPYILVRFVDYGHVGVVHLDQLRELPDAHHHRPPMAEQTSLELGDDRPGREILDDVLADGALSEDGHWIATYVNMCNPPVVQLRNVRGDSLQALIQQRFEVDVVTFALDE